MNLKFCSCRMCRRGQKTARNKDLIHHMKKAHRQKVKRLLRQGREDQIPTAISIPYTD